MIVTSLVKLRQEVIVSFSFIIVVKYCMLDGIFHRLELLNAVLVFQQIGLWSSSPISVVRVRIAKHWHFFPAQNLILFSNRRWFLFLGRKLVHQIPWVNAPRHICLHSLDLILFSLLIVSNYILLFVDVKTGFEKFDGWFDSVSFLVEAFGLFQPFNLLLLSQPFSLKWGFLQFSEAADWTDTFEVLSWLERIPISRLLLALSRINWDRLTVGSFAVFVLKFRFFKDYIPRPLPRIEMTF